MTATKEKNKQKKESWLTRAVRGHNENPSAVVKYLREYYARVSTTIVLVSILAAAAGVPIAHKLFYLPYAKTIDGEVLYGYGTEDVYILFFFSTFFTMLRALVDVPLVALAKYLKAEEENLPKFADMGWQFLYYVTAWLTGMTLFYQSSWGYCPQVGILSGMLGGPVCGFDPLFANVPHYYVSASFKWYYLLQTSFWIHQLFIMSVEMWRTDFYLYYLHHFVTIGMLVFSYFLGLTRVGTTVLVEQDFADIFLPMAKMLHYGNIEPLSTIIFASFAVAWIPTRHGIFFYILKACIDVDLEAVSNGAMSKNVQTGFVIALSFFQCLLLLWLKDLLIGIKNAITEDKLEDHREVKKA